MNAKATSRLPVAASWYETRRFGDNVTLIREAHVAPWMRCNVWHVGGRDRDLLIDSGMGLRPLKAEIAGLQCAWAMLVPGWPSKADARQRSGC
jgi:hypothetical protein